MLLLLFFHGKSRNSPEWFADNETEKRNSAILDKMNRVTRRATKNLRNNCKQLKSAILWAKNNWINRVCDNVNRSDNTRISTRTYWDSIKLLKRGMNKPLPLKRTMMLKENGDKCSSSEENAEVFRAHFEKLYYRPTTFDLSILDLLDQPDNTQHRTCSR